MKLALLVMVPVDEGVRVAEGVIEGVLERVGDWVSVGVMDGVPVAESV